MPIILPKNESVELTGNAVPSQVFKDRTFYMNDPLQKLTGTYEAPILTGDAEPGNVLKNKTFYTVDPTQKLTGTYEPPVLSGDADPGNVMLGKTFYKDDPSQKLTGTYVPAAPPVLDGDAGAGDVISGKTFYKDDAYTKLTGSLALSGNAVAGDVLAGKTFYKDDAKTKLTGTIPSKAAATITPGTVNQTIAAGQYLSGAQTIAGSANLVASNIKNGINIFGIIGTLIEGRKFATGIGSTSSGTRTYTYLGSSSTVVDRAVTVTGLTFEPAFILLFSTDSNPGFMTVYTSSKFFSSEQDRQIFSAQMTSANMTSATSSCFKEGVNEAYVNNTGFRLPARGTTSGIDCIWIAIGP